MGRRQFGNFRMILVITTVVMTAAAGLLFNAAFGSVHLIKVREVYAGDIDHPQSHFVELQMYASGQVVTQGQSVVVYNPAGAELGRFTFPANVANGANQATLLVATASAQQQFSVTPDVLMTAAVIDPSGGKVCFTGSGDCVVWGAYTGPPAGTPFNAAEGLIAGAAADRRIEGGSNSSILDAGDDTGDHAVDFRLRGPTPRNNAGSSGSYCCATGLAQDLYNVTEAAGSVTIEATRSSTSGALTVDYSTTNGTALDGSDYTGVSGTLSYADGEATKTFSIPILADPQEYNETFTVKLRNVSVGVYSIVDATVKISGELSPTPPGTPQNLTATRTANTTITLNWSAPSSDGGSAITGYKIYRSTAPGDPKVHIATVGPVLGYSNTGLGYGTTYYYQVSAINVEGEGGRSNEAYATTAVIPPGPPTSPAASPGPGLGEITVTWGPPTFNGGAQIVSYEIHRRGLQGNSTIYATVDGNTFTFTDTACSLSVRVVCYYRIRARNPAAAGTFTAEVFSPTTRVP